MPSRSASRPRPSAPARCPSRTPSRPAPLLRERAKHPGASRRGPGISPARALRTGRTHVRPPSSAQLAASGRNAWVPCNVARVFRPLALCALGATNLEARHQSDGPPPGLQAVTTTAPSASASGRNTRVPPDAARAFRPLAMARSGQSAAAPQRLAERLAERAKYPATPPRNRGISPARALRTRRDQPGGPTPARRTAAGPPGRHHHRPTHLRHRRARERAKHQGASRRGPGISPARGFGDASAHQPRTQPRTRPRTGRAPPAHGAPAGRE